MDRVTQFLSSEPDVLNVLCAAVPPMVGLDIFDEVVIHVIF